MLRLAEEAVRGGQPSERVADLLQSTQFPLAFNAAYWQMKAQMHGGPKPVTESVAQPAPAPGSPPEPKAVTPNVARGKVASTVKPAAQPAEPGSEPILQVVKKNGVGPYRRGRTMGLESPINVPRFKAAATKYMQDQGLTWEQMAQQLGGPKATKRTLQNLFFRKKTGIMWTSYGAAIEKVLGPSVMATKEEIKQCQQQ